MKKAIRISFAAVLLSVLAAGLFIFNRRRAEDVWGVAVTGLPEKVVAEQADEDMPLYILKQTHEPLLRSDNGQNYTSKTLLSWERSADSSKYLFCPDSGIKFDDDHAFTPAFLESHLKKVTPRFIKKFSIQAKNSCVAVSFDKGKKGYMQFLSMYENSPTLKKTDAIELGLGEYKVTKINRDFIQLDRKKYCRNGYNKIILYEAAADPLLDLQREDIADFNRIAWTKVPAATLERFRAFDNIPLKSSGLVFVTPDKELRRMIYNCLDIKDFRQAVSPQDHSFNDISTILPVGVPGGSPGVPEQVCAADSALRSGKTVTLAAVDRNNREMLLRAADRFYKKTGIKIIVRMYDAGDLVKTLFKRPHPYDMITIRYSVVQPEYETFFKDFSVRNGFLDYDLPEVSSLRKRLLEAEEDQEKSVLVAKINDELRDEAVVLPLYQEVRTFYYPKKIRNLAIGKGFTEYPEVADFRW